MEKLDYKIKEILSQNLEHSNEYDNAIKNTIEIISKESNFPKNNNVLYKISKLVATIVICLGVTSFATYTAINVYNQNIKKGHVETLVDNMITLEHNIHYKKVYTYEEYLTYLKLEDNLIMMTEEDFKENFFIIVALDSGRYDKLHIENISVEEETLNIDLRKPNINDSEYIMGDYVLSAKIPNKFDKESININILPSTNDMPSNYTFLENLTEDYIKKQAYLEGCIVIENNRLLSNNKDILDSFIENTQKNIDSTLRIVSYGNYVDVNVVIKDIIYRNGKYYINTCNILNDGSKKMEFSIGDKIEKMFLENTYIEYIIQCDYGIHHVIALLYK